MNDTLPAVSDIAAVTNTIWDTCTAATWINYNSGNDSNIAFTDSMKQVYVTPTALTIDSTRPLHMDRAGGTTVTIYGKGNYYPVHFWFSGGTQRTITAIDSNHFTYTSIAGTRGYKSYLDTNADWQAATISNGAYLYAVPTIDSVRPAVGAAAGGTTVTVWGHALFGDHGTIRSWLGGIALSSVSSIDSFHFTGVTGAHSAGVVRDSTFNGDSVNATLAAAFTYSSGPTITSQPTRDSVSAGQTASFSVTATSSGGALSYAWQDSTAGTWSGTVSTANPYTFTATVGQNGYWYRSVVSDANGSATSSAAQLVVMTASSRRRYGGRGLGLGLVSNAHH